MLRILQCVDAALEGPLILACKTTNSDRVTEPTSEAGSLLGTRIAKESITYASTRAGREQKKNLRL